MMNLERLDEILSETTVQLRKDDIVKEKQEGQLRVTEIFAMPHIAEAKEHRPDLDYRDVVFFVVGVDRIKAESRKQEIIDILRDYPQPERLRGGPSYIEVAGIFPWDQGQVLRLFAIGDVLELWSLITPRKLMPGVDENVERTLAGNGFVMISGYKD